MPTDTLAPLATRTTPRADAEARRTARVADVSLQQLGTLADFTETQARAYVEQGMPLAEAIARATDDTVSVARSLGLLA